MVLSPQLDLLRWKRVVYSAGFDGKPLELFYNNGEAADLFGWYSNIPP